MLKHERNMLPTLLLGLSFGVFSLIAAFTGLSELQNKSCAENTKWQTTEGTIIQIPQRKSLKSLVYTYQVEGRDFVGNREAFCAGPPKQEYLQGSRTTVYYDPGNPTTAVLRTEFQDTGIIFSSFAVSLFTLLLCVGGIKSAIRIVSAAADPTN